MVEVNKIYLTSNVEDIMLENETVIKNFYYNEKKINNKSYVIIRFNDRAIKFKCDKLEEEDYKELKRLKEKYNKEN